MLFPYKWEKHISVGQFTKENRNNEPEYRVNIWKYEIVCLCYPHLQRASTESAKLKSNTFDHGGGFPPNLEQKFLQMLQICDCNDDFTF